MNLKIIGTGSAGNCYILENETEALIIECGVNIKAIKQALEFKLNKVVGCIVTHEHGDHAKSIKEVMAAGINVYASEATHKAEGTFENHRARVLVDTNFLIGNFKVKPFDVKHDVPTVGFLINHKECGNTLFLTDTFYCPYTFPKLNNIIIEANYSKEILGNKLAAREFLKNRIIQSHMSLETCIYLLKANDLSAVNNIVLIHLSDSNSNEKYFKEQVEFHTTKKVTVASNGMEIPFNKTPF